MMLKIIKKIISNHTEFEKQLNQLKEIMPKEKLIKIKVPIKCIKLLIGCYRLGITDVKKLNKTINLIKIPNYKNK